VIRNSFVGVGVSVVPGAGTALVNNNMISEPRAAPWSGSTMPAPSPPTCPLRAPSGTRSW